MKYRTNFEYTLSRGLTIANVEVVDGSVDIAAGIGILFDSKKTDPFATGNSPLS